MTTGATGELSSCLAAKSFIHLETLRVGHFTYHGIIRYLAAVLEP